MDRIAGANMGWLDGSRITVAERKPFHIYFRFHASITIGMRVIFVN